MASFPGKPRKIRVSGKPPVSKPRKLVTSGKKQGLPRCGMIVRRSGSNNVYCTRPPHHPGGHAGADGKQKHTND